MARPMSERKGHDTVRGSCPPTADKCPVGHSKCGSNCGRLVGRIHRCSNISPPRTGVDELVAKRSARSGPSKRIAFASIERGVPFLVVLAYNQVAF